jgi:hypothetical protein
MENAHTETESQANMEWCPLLKGHVFVIARPNADGSFEVGEIRCEHNPNGNGCKLYDLLNTAYVERVGERAPYRDGECNNL